MNGAPPIQHRASRRASGGDSRSGCPGHRPAQWRQLAAGDAATVENEAWLRLDGATGAEVLLFDLLR